MSDEFEGYQVIPEAFVKSAAVIEGLASSVFGQAIKEADAIRARGHRAVFLLTRAGELVVAEGTEIVLSNSAFSSTTQERP